MDFGLIGFLQFAAYYFILKILLQVINLEARRAPTNTTLAGVSGLVS